MFRSLGDIFPSLDYETMKKQYGQSLGTISGTCTAYTVGTATPQPERKKTMFENVKGYVEKHRDLIFTLGIVILLDHFLFKGALKNKIQTIIEGVVKKVEDKFHQEV